MQIKARRGGLAIINNVNYAPERRSRDVWLKLKVKEKWYPLLQALLIQLRRSRQTPLQFGIDSEGIADAALLEFFDGVQGDSRQRLDWQLATGALDGLVAQCLQLECSSPGEEALISSGFPNPHSRCEMSALALDATPHPLVLWLERFYTVMSEVHPQAIDIVGLRVEGFEDRDIAKRLELGLRLVKGIVRDMHVNWGVSGKE
jgi:hypothetical protein